MLLREVGYARPESLDEALELLRADDGARALAGGQTLINVMKARAGSPDALIDLGGIDELKFVPAKIKPDEFKLVVKSMGRDVTGQYAVA